MSISFSKYYTYFDEYGENLEEHVILSRIHLILKKYSRQSWIKSISSITQLLDKGDSLDAIKHINRKVLGLVSDKIIIHNRVLLTASQFVFNQTEYENTEGLILYTDLFDLSILINSFYEFKNEAHLTSDEAFFHSSFRDIQASFNISDLHYSFHFFL